MVLTTTSVEVKGPMVGDPDGEVRLDAEGKGYWHSFKKDKKPVVEPSKPVATNLSKPKKPAFLKMKKKK